MSCTNEDSIPLQEGIERFTYLYIQYTCLGISFGNTLTYRFGMCEPYSESMKVCDDIFRVGVDYVFVPRIHDTQSSQEAISKFLSLEVLQLQNSSCRDNILQIICHYYLSPCGTKSFPYSICPEDCNAVQKKCSVEWKAVQQGLKEYQFIDCTYTSTLLSPLKSCCKRVGLQFQPSATPIQPSATPIQPLAIPIKPSAVEGENSHACACN